MTDNEINELKMRVSSLERSTALLHVDFANINKRMDSYDKRLDRIERRLEIQE